MFKGRKQNDRAVAYLLGELTGRELESFEERVFTEPNAADEVEAAEHDLIDAHLRGELDAAQTSAFERVYLGSPSRRNKVKAATIMRERLFVDAPKQAEVQSESRWAFWQIFRTPLFAAAAVLIGAVALAGWFLLARSGSPPAIADRYPEVPEITNIASVPDPGVSPQTDNGNKLEIPKREKDPPQPSALPKVFAATLFPATRGSERPTLAIPKNAAGVVVRLVHDNQKEFEKYRVVVRDGSGRIVISRDMPARSGRTIAVALKPSRITDGNYEAALLGINANERGEELMFYEFLVKRK